MSELATTNNASTASAATCTWYSKMSECLRRNRNQVEPYPGEEQQAGVEYFTVAPRRVLRVLKPELKSEKFYEPVIASDRPESLVDNFYSRWARRPHPSSNCRCSFRHSVGSNRLSSHEEQIISRQINRIRTSLCEAEISGQNIEELEKTLTVDLSQLDEVAANKMDSVSLKETQMARIDCLDECAKKKIVRDLDRYISELLDEILNDTIKAAIERERQDVRPTSAAPSFDISFTFHNSKDADRSKQEADKGYVNRGFVGTENDPDTLDFCLRTRRDDSTTAAMLDCIDSGINSVETVELQTSELEDEHNLEQSLMDIIDAKLGGSSIGKSLEDLGMEIDAEDATLANKSKQSSEARPPSETISEGESSSRLESEKSTTSTENSRASPNDAPVERASKSLDTIEEPAFNSLRLEFKRNSSEQSTSTKTEEVKQQQSTSFVSSKVNKTVSVIRQRLATRLAHQPRNKPKKKNSKKKKKKSETSGNGSSTSSSSNSERPHSRTSMRAALELEDYRRRFPVPETSRGRNNNNNNNNEGEDEVTLRNRKPMIVFLHGFGSSAESFEPQLNYFANLGYPCVAPDLLGHGFSSAPNRPKDYQFDKLLKDLEAVLLHYAFKPGQKCVLVAHNYGCSFAAALAYKYVSNVHQLVLISGGGPTPLAPPPAEGVGHCCLRASLAPLLVCGMNRAVLYSARGRQHPYCGFEELEEQWPSHMRHVLRGMSWPDGDYVFHRRICTPTLLVHGLRDNKVSLVQECQMERTMIKAFLEAIPSAGHVPMTDCPEQLNHMINCFIDLWKNKKW